MSMCLSSVIDVYLDPTSKTENNPGRQRYASSKLANIMWAYALHRRLETLKAKHITVVAFDPGLMPGTGLAREGEMIWFLLSNS